VITTSGTLVTALLAVAALVSRSSDFELSTAAATLVSVATAMFLIAASAAIATNVPRSYEEVGEGELHSWVNADTWPDRDAERTAAARRVDLLLAARRANDIKARWLIVAMGSEVLAVLALTVAVAIVLQD
jgi:hypothetical protein